ncbi:MAG: hypothetical protein ACRD2J_03170 [Thermoanaerobaculia bacterium]
MKIKISIVAALVALMATGAMASNFRSADIVYVPVAGKTLGANSAFFLTDAFISNVNAVSVDVWVAFAQAGQNNAGAPAAATKLTTALAANERREIRDIMGAVFGVTDQEAQSGQGVIGHLLFFSCRTGGNCDECVDNPDCLPITVETRTFNRLPDGSTFGVTVPGLPWYNYVSPDAADRNLDEVFIVGIRQDAEFRTNVGLVNASQFSNATLRLRLFNANGTQFGSTVDRTLPPLGFEQPNVASLFPGFTGSGAWLTVEQLPLSSGSDPGFFAFATLTDNRTNDPTWLESQYIPQLDFNCVYGAKPQRRPVDHP